MSATGNRATNNGDDPALTRFDATAASTFAVLCHLTVGDHVTSERLLADVYVGRGDLAASTDAATALTLRAHQVYLADAADTADTGSPRSVHILANLTPAERVALSLAEIEHQTATDSTAGPSRPLGQRGAVVADSVGPGFQGLHGLWAGAVQKLRRGSPS